jgi:hypothetical protein
MTGSWANHHGDNHGLRSFDPSHEIQYQNHQNHTCREAFSHVKKIRDDSCVLCVLLTHDVVKSVLCDVWGLK